MFLSPHLKIIIKTCYALLFFIGIVGLIAISLLPKPKQAYYAGVTTTLLILLTLAVSGIGASIEHIYHYELLPNSGYITFTKKASQVSGLVAIVFVYELTAIASLLEKAGIEISRSIVATTVLLDLLLQAVLIMPCIQLTYLEFDNALTAVILFVGLACLRNRKLFKVGLPGIILIFGVLIMVLAYIQIHLR